MFHFAEFSRIMVGARPLPRRGVRWQQGPGVSQADGEEAMDDLDASGQANQLSKTSRHRIGRAAMVLADLVNQYNRQQHASKRNLHWPVLVHDAFEVVAVRCASGDPVPDAVIEQNQYVELVIDIMIGLSEELIENLVRQVATNIVDLNGMERDLHATQILERLEMAVLADDEQAQRIWPLMLKQHSSPEIDRTCDFLPGTADTIKKRIYRRARTFLRGLLYGQGE